MSGAYVHGYDARANERLEDQAAHARRPASPRHRLPGRKPACSRPVVASAPRRSRWRSTARKRASPRSTSRRARSPRPRAGPRRAGVTNVEFCQADMFDLPFEPGLVRPRLRLLPARAPRHGRSRRSSGLARPAQARRHDHGDRGRPRVGLLPSGQRGGPRRDPLSGGAAGGRPAATPTSAAASIRS